MPRRKKRDIRNKEERFLIGDGLAAIISKRKNSDVTVRARRAKGTANKPPVNAPELLNGITLSPRRAGGEVFERFDVQLPDISKVSALATHGMELEGTGRIFLKQQRARAFRSYRGLYVSEESMGLPGLADSSVEKLEESLDADFVDLIHGRSTLARRIETLTGASPKALARGDMQDFLECLYYIENPEELPDEEEPPKLPDGEGGTGEGGDSEREGEPTDKKPDDGDKEGEPTSGEGKEPSKTPQVTKDYSDKKEERKDPLKDWVHAVEDATGGGGGYKLGGGGGGWAAGSISVARAESFDPSTTVLGQVPHHKVVVSGRPVFKVNLHRHAQGVLAEQETFRTQRLDSTGDIGDYTWEVNIGNMRSFERPAKNSAKLVIAVDMSGSMGCWCGRDFYGDHDWMQSGTLAMQVQAALGQKFPDAYVFGFSAGSVMKDARTYYAANVMFEMKAGYRPFCNHGHFSKDHIREAEEKQLERNGWTPYATSYLEEETKINELEDMPETALGNGNPDCAAMQHMSQLLNGQFENAFAVIISDGAPAGITYGPPRTMPGWEKAPDIDCAGNMYNPHSLSERNAAHRSNIGIVSHTKNLAHAMAAAGMRFQSVLINKPDDDIYPAEKRTYINQVSDIPKLAEVMTSLQESMS